MGNCSAACSEIVRELNPPLNMKTYLIPTIIMKQVRRDVILWLNARDLIGYRNDRPHHTVVYIPLYWADETRQKIFKSITNGQIYSPYTDSEFHRKDIVEEPTEKELAAMFEPLS